MFNKQVLKTILVLFILVLVACTSPAQSTPVFIPVVVTVEVLKVITATPGPVLTPLPTLTSAPVNTQTQNLEEDASLWKIYSEGSPIGIIANADRPFIEGKSLKCSITGGKPYSNVHCYRNLLSEPEASAFTLSMAFQFVPTTTCNNLGSNSVVQAIEFSMSKWYQSKRYEFAVQWENVGSGAPLWRYWDPSKPEAERWTPINSSMTDCLEGGKWHTLKLEGNIVDGQVHYQNFTINDVMYKLDLTVIPAPAPGENDRLAVAVQADGNAVETPYDVFIDRVNFLRQSLAPIVDCRTVKKATIIQPRAEEVIKKNITVQWSPPACPMALQYYQNNDPKPIFSKIADSGQFDFSMIPVGKTEIKIWVPGNNSPTDSFFVTVY